MNQEDIKKALEALGKGGITVAGDLVLEKHVEHEVNNVEAGGIGIQIINSKAETKSTNEIKQAVMKLMDETDSTGKSIIQDQQQWWGIKMVLVQHCGFPCVRRCAEGQGAPAEQPEQCGGMRSRRRAAGAAGAVR